MTTWQAYVRVYGVESYWYWNRLGPHRMSEEEAKGDIEAYLSACKNEGRVPSTTKIEERVFHT